MVVAQNKQYQHQHQLIFDWRSRLEGQMRLIDHLSEPHGDEEEISHLLELHSASVKDFTEVESCQVAKYFSEAAT